MPTEEERRISDEGDPALVGRRKGDFVTRRQLLVAGAIVGVAMALTLGAVVWIAFRINDFQQDQIAKNTKINEKQDALIDGLRKLTNPTPEEYRRALKEGIERCLKEPTCRELFPRLGKRSRAATRRDRAQRVSDEGSSPEPQNAPAGSAPDTNSPRTPSRPKPSDRPASDPAPAPAPTAQPPPASGSEPEPLIDIKGPILPPVCIGKVVGINCREGFHSSGRGAKVCAGGPQSEALPARRHGVDGRPSAHSPC